MLSDGDRILQADFRQHFPNPKLRQLLDVKGRSVPVQDHPLGQKLNGKVAHAPAVGAAIPQTFPALSSSTAIW